MMPALLSRRDRRDVLLILIIVAAVCIIVGGALILLPSPSGGLHVSNVPGDRGAARG
jgi:hypothetical protein